jgi:hypothetical protein
MSCLVEEHHLDILPEWTPAAVEVSPVLHPAGVYLAQRLTRAAVWLGFLRIRSARPGWVPAAVHAAAGLGCGVLSGMADALGWCIRRRYCNPSRASH